MIIFVIICLLSPMPMISCLWQTMQQQPNGISTSVDWGRFGLGNREETVHFSRNEYPSIRNNSLDSPNSGYGRGGHQATDPNELFAQEQVISWWFIIFTIHEFYLTLGKNYYFLIFFFPIYKEYITDCALLNIINK